MKTDLPGLGGEWRTTARDRVCSMYVMYNE